MIPNGFVEQYLWWDNRQPSLASTATDVLWTFMHTCHLSIVISVGILLGRRDDGCLYTILLFG